ncbi:MAG: tRNA (adenosine(37)-N6)-threonylcarbamoyltransferase complex dimerization subunit type 1 TsaB [Tannerella sp.]|jgi:tRNA threonylcarbamoyladenosine biosynthesis protein TsaB|nr:tRNA (adenosine(37)-N6)-threonylcarbamoyltransferase complex dimerization subunit type 1 TsaB [Tannerella sp.]
MAIINIETATAVCSAALSEKGEVVFEKTLFEGASHASMLGVFVEEAVKEMKHHELTVDAVSVSSGPGSYTGLRIGVSMAKGLCFGWNVPLLNIPTLDIMASKALKRISPDKESPGSFLCAMIDARRMEVYTAVYDRSLRKIRDTGAEIVTEETYAALLEKQKVYFFGSGASKCKDIIQSPNAVFIEDIHPLASDMAVLSEQAFENGRFEDIVYFEPFYLKDFIATVAKNKLSANE